MPTPRRTLRPGCIDMKPRKNSDFEEWFMPTPESGCWLWIGCVNNQGYGQRKGIGYAHRFSFERYVRPLLEGEIVMHTCDTPSCVNPAHLRVGTMQDNTHDMIAKGRDRLIGERSGRSKLTPEQVLAIRCDKRSRHEIATDYGISPSHAHAIRSGVFWTSL